MDDSGITILNVDGSGVGLYVKSRLLREAGYRVIEARTGADALRLIASESPQLVLLNVDLPDCSGFETLGRIRAEAAPSSQDAPPLVLLVSTKFIGSERRARALEEGADGYLLEPVTPEFLLANVKMLLRRSASDVEIAHTLADERSRGRTLESFSRLALAVNSAGSLDEVLRIAAGEARELIGAHQAVASLNPDALDLNDPASGGPEAAVSLSERYAQAPAALSRRRCETWFSSLVCRLNQPMRLTQAELESQLDHSRKTDKTRRHLRALEEVITPREVETLRRMACLREVAGLSEVATPREIAGLREVAAMSGPQILRGLDMRGWLAAPLTSRAAGGGRNLGLIQLSDKYDGEFTEQDETALAQIAQMVSIAVENRLCWCREWELREAAENAARAKDEFMATTSYRLRAQLNTMLGWSWVLRRQADNIEDVTRAAEIIERAARAQARLVEDLLGASRKGAVKWSEGEMEGQGDGGPEGWRGEEAEGLWERETEEWKEGETGRVWEREMEEWREGESLKFHVPPALRPSVSHSLRPSARHSPNSASRGLAAGGGC